MRLIRTIGNWLDQRVQLGAPIRGTMQHPIPRDTASWYYVFGSAALTVFGLQLVTGIFLALSYVPSAGEAWNSLQLLNHQVTFGWFIRALHGWGSNFMVAIVLIHMAQVFLFGAFKYPRELTWILGVFLLLMTLGMAFTGQVLRFDQDAYWGLGIGASIVSRVPLLGPSLAGDQRMAYARPAGAPLRLSGEIPQHDPYGGSAVCAIRDLERMADLLTLRSVPRRLLRIRERH